MRTSISAGPIYAERAQTLGRGPLFVSLARTGLHYETLRGVPLDAIPLAFTHQNVDFPNCDAVFSADCTLYGVPTFENEVIDFTLGLDGRGSGGFECRAAGVTSSCNPLRPAPTGCAGLRGGALPWTREAT